MKITEYPHLVAEWDETENTKNGLLLEQITSGSTKKAFWICSRGHHYSARIDHRASGSGCPYCAGLRPIIGENDLATLFPHIILEWNYEKNTKAPSEYLPQSNKKVSWICSTCGNGYLTTIQHRTQGGGCPECAKKIRGISKRATAVRKVGSIIQTHPEIAAEWDNEKNYPLTASEVTAGSSKRVWWIGSECGHSYDMSVHNRCLSGMGCPVCTGKRLLVGFNDLATTHPEIAQYWDEEKNGLLKPTDILYGTDRKVWWQCERGHSWRTAPYAKYGCPICNNKKVLKGYNDLTTIYPEMAKEWSDKNKKAPDEVIAGSNKRFWWKCIKCGHEWTAAGNDRVQGRGCPQCASRQRVITANETRISNRGSLADNNPIIAAEWNADRNKELTPFGVLSGSDQKVWWKCALGHEWQATISSRTAGIGCPICAGELSTSFPEQTILYYLGKSTSAFSRKKIGKYEVDIWLPDLNCAIEFNGRYWHRDKTANDLTKAENIRKKGVRLFVIHECDENRFDGDEIYYQYTNAKYVGLGSVIAYILDHLNLQAPDIDISRDEKEIRAQYYQVKPNSIAAVYPHLVAEWDYEANTPLTPEQVSYGSKQKVWWKCPQCHQSYQAVVHSRKKTGCPFCAGKRPIKGVNDLGTLCPELVEEWDFERNSVNPDDITAGSNMRIWWICKRCRNEWQTPLKVRARMGCGCPVCSIRK